MPSWVPLVEFLFPEMVVGCVSLRHPQPLGVVRSLLHTGETEPWLTCSDAYMEKWKLGLGGMWL